MKLYRLSGNNFDTRYARAVLADDPEPPIECPSCNRMLPRQEEKLNIAWATGRDQNPLTEVSDFTWPCGLQFIVVRDDARRSIAVAVPNAVVKDVEMVGIAQAGSGRILAAGKSVTMPSNALPLWWLTSEHVIHLDIDKSGRRPENCCGQCGKCDWIVADNAHVVISASELGGAT